MRVIQGYFGNFIKGSQFNRDLLFASAWQYKKYNPEDEIILYAPEIDLQNLDLFKYDGVERPWSNLHVLPVDYHRPLYDMVRYELMSIQEEDFTWLDPDVLTFVKIPELKPGEVDFIGYGNEGKENLYPDPQEKDFQKFLSKSLYRYHYHNNAYNMGFCRTTAELGTIIGMECLFFLKELSKMMTYWNPRDVRYHHFCSQSVPAMVLERFHKVHRDIAEFYPELEHPVWHLVWGDAKMPDGTKLSTIKTGNRSLEDKAKSEMFWHKLSNLIIKKRGISWEELCEFYLDFYTESKTKLL